jgi:hypothetical protein
MIVAVSARNARSPILGMSPLSVRIIAMWDFILVRKIINFRQHKQVKSSGCFK